ncbi:hypothetical protein Pcinc_016464 [Petrolisthes cinctipes]|uniref:Uncharacterized protein n=1 Tax=Petrolisthes cinctipes TaxID=88211 RepID=A0AAE1FSE0_PETCI|nr:hypothetical protein Pcinc_016464 [Petrolisthes cinctipes]
MTTSELLTQVCLNVEVAKKNDKDDAPVAACHLLHESEAADHHSCYPGGVSRLHLSHTDGACDWFSPG